MGRKSKYPVEIKLKYINKYKSGKMKKREIADELQVSMSTIKKWISVYDHLGKNALITTTRNKKYTTELKQQIVEEYLEGNITYAALARKYKIPSESQIITWVKVYNTPNGFKAKRIGVERRMTKGRQTTLEERIEIVKYHLEKSNDYEKTAQKFKISYQQIYGWLQKYESQGVDGLIDRRGKRKLHEEMTELEKLQYEYKLLEAKNKRKDMEIAYLKKLAELEGRLK